jgi:nitrogen fixation/metabolism regulation signal transduction histidine kinase
LDWAELSDQCDDIAELGLLTQGLEAVNDLVLILNGCRQIVFANRGAQQLLGAAARKTICGLRPGEAMRCIRACHSPGGCGTADACPACGAFQAILSCQGGRPDVQECRIIQEGSGDALDLLVRTTPLSVHGDHFLICAIKDISHEKRRRALERVFFHDVLNTAGGVLMLAARLANGTDKPDDRQRLHPLLAQMVEEIIAQKDLMAAEISELALRVEEFSVRELVDGMVQLYLASPVCQDRWLFVEECPDSAMRSDRALLGRVLGNIIKNALEGAPKNSAVAVSARAEGGGVEFSVQNQGVIPPDIQAQMFHRSFSTKGSGRGLGTYSIKLLTERYLAGRVHLISNPDDGTIIRVWYPLTLTVPQKRES